MFTERFSERAQVLAVTYPASYSSEQNTAFVNVGNFHRWAILIIAGNIGTSLDADVEVTTDGVSADLATLSGKSITQLTQAGSDDDSVVIIEGRNEELTIAGVHHDWIRLESTPSGASLYCVVVLGIEPRSQPVSTSFLDEVVD